ncbi:transcriptional regulator [Marinomonas rhizomae]|uniref:Rof transcriptional antiterminator n=1 Tax=Marinomonas rhizomae TaxID=491948 RepID=A0A366J838_9GAMM|nr:Rho-binding antiterminator [Marinomonas rhizomae]RBP82519.1 Rof transcriptional antiterminator [Marinomonas rhizomae]RNF73694.1 transcriptional regulator [Marinomonas rhizomae]
MMTCHEYDYIEIVCLFHYPIRLTMVTGVLIEGVALDTARNESRAESIKIQTGDGIQLVALSEVTKLAITIDNPHFTEVHF